MRLQRHGAPDENATAYDRVGTESRIGRKVQCRRYHQAIRCRLKIEEKLDPILEYFVRNRGFRAVQV